MPIVVRPDPPLPMSVAIAARVYGSELRIALIDYYRENPGTSQKAARVSLDIPQSAVSANLTVLVEAGVLISEADPNDRRHRVYSLDLQRARELLSALSRHILGHDVHQRPDGQAPS